MLPVTNKVSFLLIAIALFCFSCRDKPVNTSPLDIIPRLKGILVFDTLPLQVDMMERVCVRPIIKQDTVKGFGIFQRHSNRVVITDHNGKIVDTVMLPSNGNSELVDVYFKSMDSFYSYRDYNNLILSNKNQVLATWVLDSAKTSGYYAYTAPAINRLTIDDSSFIMMLVNTPTGDELADMSGINSGKPTLGHFKLDSALISLKAKFGVYAKSTGPVYLDFFSLFAVIDTTSVVYCNQHENTIYRHELNTGKTASKALESCCFLPNKPFPADSMNSIPFTIKYSVENTRNMNLLYDPYRKYIYRVHNIKPAQIPADEVAMIEDCPLVLTILNLDLDIVGEYALPPRKYNPAHFMVTPAGLLLRTRSKKELAYDVFVP